MFGQRYGKTQEALIPFPKGQDARCGSSECSSALDLFAPLIIPPLKIIIKKNKEMKKHLNFVFLRVTFTRKGFPRSQL